MASAYIPYPNVVDELPLICLGETPKGPNHESPHQRILRINRNDEINVKIES